VKLLFADATESCLRMRKSRCAAPGDGDPWSCRAPAVEAGAL